MSAPQLEAGKQQATTVLSNLGFRVQYVPVSDRRTADLLVSDDEAEYIIEVKDKSEAESLAQLRREVLASGELYEQSDPLSRDNRISGILADAQQQLDRTPKREGTFQIIWFHATGIDADLKLRQAFATFYGHVALIAMNPRLPITAECFYFDYNAAFDLPTVEALILADRKQLQVCLNEFSHRAAEFRQSPLCRKFAEQDGVVDPVAMEANGRIIRCRADVSRKNEADVIQALQAQTGILYSPIRLNRHTVSVATHPQDIG
jgi:hypothetical protein